MKEDRWINVVAVLAAAASVAWMVFLVWAIVKLVGWVVSK